MALWIALLPPQLPLQAAGRGLLIDLPLVIGDGPEAHPMVLGGNAAARRFGISKGMPVSAARALCAELVVLPRKPEAEERALRHLALAALEFTPTVSLFKSAVLLEVETSLKLFGGLGALLGRVKQSVSHSGYHVVMSVAPTPLAAWLIAKARVHRPGERSARTLSDLPERLAELPLMFFDWPDATIQALATLGIVRIRDMLRLPRDGVLRRFGEQVITDLDHAFGKRPDPLPLFTAPVQFASLLELARETDSAEQLLMGCDRLFAELLTFLRVRDLAVAEIALTLIQGREQSTMVPIITREPSRDPKRWRPLVREKLSQIALQDAVYAIALKAVRLMPYQPVNDSFLPDRQTQAQALDRLMEQLSARLGAGSILTVAVRSEHRPERAWCANSDAQPPQPHDTLSRSTPPTRPAFLLQRPRALMVEDDWPRYHGKLSLLTGPERIETGWWDGQPARRDYYVARNPYGETVWLYRDLSRKGEWMLHGVFA